MMHHEPPAGLSRRALLRRTLATGAYTAPAILSLSVVSPVAAATPAPGACSQPVAFLQDAVLLGVAPNVPFDLYAQPAGSPTASKIGSFKTDDFGVAMGVFALAPQNTSVVTSVTLSVFLTGTAPPAPSSATFVSPLVASLACTQGGPRAAAALFATVVQEPTTLACTVGPLNQWQERVDVELVNAQLNATYDIYVQANTGTGGAVKAGSVTTNGQGNGAATLAATVGTTVGNPGMVTVTAVPAGAPATPASFTFTAAPTGNAATSTLFTLSCSGTVTSQSVTKPLLIGVH